MPKHNHVRKFKPAEYAFIVEHLWLWWFVIKFLLDMFEHCPRHSSIFGSNLDIQPSNVSWAAK